MKLTAEGVRQALQSGTTTVGPTRGPRARFGRYEVEREVGRGGMGVVYRAHDAQLDRPVALKVLLLGAPGPESHERRERFEREARTLATLRHRSIPRVLDFGEAKGLLFLVTDFLSGESLAQTVYRGAPMWERITALRDAANALQHAHDQGILHRDVKPENIFWDGQAGHLVDFGLAKELDPSHSSAALTKTGGVMMGTLAYLAPEQVSPARFGAVSPRTDVRALGGTLYFCLTGRVPLRVRSPYELLMALLKSDPAPPREIAPDVPAELDRLCSRCLVREQSKRLASAAEVAEALDEWLLRHPPEHGGPAEDSRDTMVLDGLAPPGPEVLTSASQIHVDRPVAPWRAALAAAGLAAIGLLIAGAGFDLVGQPADDSDGRRLLREARAAKAHGQLGAAVTHYGAALELLEGEDAEAARRERDEVDRVRALLAAAATDRDPAAVVPLAEYVRDGRDAELRLEALAHLARMRERAAAAALVPATEDADARVRQAAVRALALIGGPEALAFIGPAITAGLVRGVDRRRALEELLGTDDPRAVGSLTEVLDRDHHLSAQEQAWVCKRLGEHKDPTAAAALTRLAGDADARTTVRFAAVEALLALPPDAAGAAAIGAALPELSWERAIGVVERLAERGFPPDALREPLRKVYARAVDPVGRPSPAHLRTLAARADHFGLVALPEGQRLLALSLYLEAIASGGGDAPGDDVRLQTLTAAENTAGLVVDNVGTAKVAVAVCRTHPTPMGNGYRRLEPGVRTHVELAPGGHALVIDRRASGGAISVHALTLGARDVVRVWIGADAAPDPAASGDGPVVVPAELAAAIEQANRLVMGGQLARAIAQIERIADDYKGYAVVHVWLGSLYVDAGRHDEAAWRLEQAVRLAPGMASAWTGLGRLRLAQRDHTGADGAYREALRLDADNASALHGLAWIKLARGQYEPAAALVRRAIATETDLAASWQLMGDIRRHQGRPELAIEAFDKSLEQLEQQGRPSAAVRLTRGIVLTAAGRFEEAERDAADAAKERPRSADPWLLRAEIAAARGDAEKALEAFAQAKRRGIPAGTPIASMRFHALLRDDPRYRELSGSD